ncbi:hypothetical protein [Aquicella lusitana]|uniref:Uncharacterized protein n=1 Tax=Aquicella lusitana TaxID=254246 RepID=A0A370GZF2_9COXI|nr:hypothetical protein [Aquicella lusitana]RDI48660.1 hypothetical protein C8D86_10289 [Aquicella lusitana]VVC73963.1 hypothetical protein AQULUS_17240 [Aquicella lusitana]
MTEVADLSAEYILAEGPDGLAKVLDSLLEESRKDRAFAEEEHFILYKLGNQKAVIKVDTSEVPFHFWYFDLLGRPMTGVVKQTIADFLWDKCGEKERYAKDLGEE